MSAELVIDVSGLTKKFGDRVVIGYSDHVRPEDDGSVPALEYAAIMGVRVIEKHFTDNKQGVGNDHYHAVDEADLRAFSDKLPYNVLTDFQPISQVVSSQNYLVARPDLPANNEIGRAHV